MNLNQININFDHGKLHKLYVGKFGEQLLKLYFIINGIDTYEPLIDDKGIDFVARVSDEQFYDIQVKTVRMGKKNSYVYITKETWKNKLRDNLLVAFVVLQENLAPVLLIVPSLAWKTDLDGNILCDRDYVGKKSKPEWGISINSKTLSYLSDNYGIDKVLSRIVPIKTDRVGIVPEVVAEG